MKRILYYILIALIAGCAGQGPAPEDHYYRLPPVSAGGDQAPLTDGVIFVERLLAEGVYRERSILYSGDPEAIELSRYHYQHWIDTPSRMIRDHLIDYLRASHQAGQIVFIADVPAHFSIYGRIRQFERRLTASGITIAVALEFRVTAGTGGTPLLLKQYSRTEEIGSDSMAASVNVFARLLGDIYGELVEDIRAQGG